MPAVTDMLKTQMVAEAAKASLYEPSRPTTPWASHLAVAARRGSGLLL